MKNLLVFHWERDFNDDIRIVANNEKDLESYLEEKGYSKIAFLNINEDYGTCCFNWKLCGMEVAKCFYVEYI